MAGKIFIWIFLIFFILFVNVVESGNVKKSADEGREDTGEQEDLSMEIPVESETVNNVTCTRRRNSQVHEIRAAAHKQFPFMASIMAHDHTHLCSGSVVSNGLILTSSKCIASSISYVLLNTTRDRKDETTAVLHVIKQERFPTTKDIGLIYTEKHNSSIAAKIKLSNYSNPTYLSDIEALGFGLNADVGQRKDLQYVGLEKRGIHVILKEPTLASEVMTRTDELQGVIDCIDSKVKTCFKDMGGPVIYDNELVGVITEGTDECFSEMTATYAIQKNMVTFIPTFVFKAWLDDKIKKNEQQDEVTLPIYPMRVGTRKTIHKMARFANGALPSTSIHYIVYLSFVLAKL